jgi:hypothetical protein
LALRKKLVADFPDVPGYRRGLADAYNRLGLLMALMPSVKLADGFNGLSLLRGLTPRWKEAEQYHREALAIRKKLVADFPTVPDYQSELGASLNNLAMVRKERGDLAEARQLLEQAVGHQRAARRTNRGNPTYRLFLRNHYLELSDVLVRMKEHAGAAKAAAELPGAFPDGWQEYHRAAGFLARCVPLAETDTRLPESRRKEAARSYADQSMRMLRHAVQKGFPGRKTLGADSTFGPLRPRQDFRQLVDEVPAKKP